MATKLGKMAADNEELPLIKLLDPSATRFVKSFDILNMAS